MGRPILCFRRSGGGFAVTNGYDQNTYIWAPGIGYANKNIDVSLRYEAYTDYDTDTNCIACSLWI